MTYATHEDMREIRRYIHDTAFLEALDHIRPASRSTTWAYWNSKMGRYPAPPMPERRFD